MAATTQNNQSSRINFTIDDNRVFAYIPKSKPRSISAIQREMKRDTSAEAFSENEIKKSLRKLASAGYVEETMNGSSSQVNGKLFQKTDVGSLLDKLLGQVSLEDVVTIIRKEDSIRIIGEYSAMLRKGGMVVMFDENGVSIGPLAETVNIRMALKGITRHLLANDSG